MPSTLSEAMRIIENRGTEQSKESKMLSQTYGRGKGVTVGPLAGTA
jgi:hypothetical protein